MVLIYNASCSGESGKVEDELIELTLDPYKNKTGDHWHISVEVSC